MNKKVFDYTCKALFGVYGLFIIYVVLFILSFGRLLLPQTWHCGDFVSTPEGEYCNKFIYNYLSIGTMRVELLDLYTFLGKFVWLFGVVVFFVYIIFMIQKIHSVTKEKKLKYMFITIIGAILILLSIPAAWFVYGLQGSWGGVSF